MAVPSVQTLVPAFLSAAFVGVLLGLVLDRVSYGFALVLAVCVTVGVFVGSVLQ